VNPISDTLSMTEVIMVSFVIDPEYIAFLESMNAEPTDADKEMKLSETELC